MTPSQSLIELQELSCCGILLAPFHRPHWIRLRALPRIREQEAYRLQSQMQVNTRNLEVMMRTLVDPILDASSPRPGN